MAVRGTSSTTSVGGSGDVITSAPTTSRSVSHAGWVVIFAFTPACPGCVFAAGFFAAGGRRDAHPSALEIFALSGNKPEHGWGLLTGRVTYLHVQLRLLPPPS